MSQPLCFYTIIVPKKWLRSAYKGIQKAIVAKHRKLPYLWVFPTLRRSKITFPFQYAG